MLMKRRVVRESRLNRTRWKRFCSDVIFHFTLRSWFSATLLIDVDMNLPGRLVYELELTSFQAIRSICWEHCGGCKWPTLIILSAYSFLSYYGPLSENCTRLVWSNKWIENHHVISSRPQQTLSFNFQSHFVFSVFVPRGKIYTDSGYSIGFVPIS